MITDPALATVTIEYADHRIVAMGLVRSAFHGGPAFDLWKKNQLFVLTRPSLDLTVRPEQPDTEWLTIYGKKEAPVRQYVIQRDNPFDAKPVFVEVTKSTGAFGHVPLERATRFTTIDDAVTAVQKRTSMYGGCDSEAKFSFVVVDAPPAPTITRVV